MGLFDNDQTAQNVAALAQGLPRLTAAVEALQPMQTQALTTTTTSTTSTTSAASSNLIGTWTVNVKGGQGASSPTSIDSQVFDTPAGGALISNPTSNTLIVLLYQGAVPSSPSVQNAAQIQVVRPYSWDSIIAAPPFRAWAVMTYGLVTSQATNAQISALVVGRPGSGRMQEDITSSTSKYWIDTQLVAGDKISATAPWGGSVNLIAATIAGGGKVTTVQIAPGLSGQVSGTVAGGAVIIGPNYGGTLKLQSARNLDIKMGQNVRLNLTVPQYGRDSQIRLGNNVSGSAVWSSQTSGLDVGDNSSLVASTGAGTMTFGTARLNAYNSSNHVRVGDHSTLMMNVPMNVSATGGSGGGWIIRSNAIDVGDGVSATISATSTNTSGSAIIIHASFAFGDLVSASVAIDSSGSSFVSVNEVALRIGRNVNGQHVTFKGNSVAVDARINRDGGALTLDGANNVQIVVPPGTAGLLAPSAIADAFTISGTGFISVPGNRPIWWSTTATTHTASFTSPALTVGDCQNLNFNSQVKALTGTLTWNLQTKGPTGAWTTRQSLTASATGTMDASFGPGLQYNIAVGQNARWEAVLSGTTSPSAELTYSFVGTGGAQ